MSKRLDSINKTAAPGGSVTSAKPALKFKPKVVSRKTKEEREKAGKINTPGVNKIAEKNKKFTAKKPTGNNRNNKLNGTQLVISGPLSEGTISLGNGGSNGRSASPGMGAANPLLERLKSKNAAAKNMKKKVKKEEDGGFSGGIENSDSDSDLDDNAIDMSRKSFNEEGDNKDFMDMDMDDIDTDLFPVRAERNEHHEYGEPSKLDKTIKTEFHNAHSVIPSEPGTREATSSLTGTPAPITTAEGLKSRSASPADGMNDLGDEVLHMNDFQEREEVKQASKDFSELSKSLKHLNMNGSNGTSPDAKPSLFFMQLPCSLPVLEGGNDGQIGKIRIHKSGRMSLKIGKVKFDISRGGSSDFVQEVILVDPENGQCYHVGGVKDKITAVPHII